MVAHARDSLAAEPFAAWCPRPAVWRVGLALALAIDLALVTLLTVGAVLESPERLTSLGPPWSAIGYTPVLLGVAALGLAAISRFGRGPGRLLTLLGALLANGTVYTAASRLSDSPPEWTLFGVVAAFGWVCGLLAARALGYRAADGPAAARAAERLAGAAACATLAAAYVKSGLYKVDFSGLGWVDGTTLRAAIAMHIDADPSSLRFAIADFFLHQPTLTRLMSGLGLVAELGAFLFLIGPRLRAVWGTLIIGFHLSVFVAAPILFPGPIVLFAFISYPWHRRMAAPATTTDANVWTPPPVAGRGLAVVAAGGALLVAAGAAVPPGPVPVLGVGHEAPVDPLLTAVHEDLSTRGRLGRWSIIEAPPAAPRSLTVWVSDDPGQPAAQLIVFRPAAQPPCVGPSVAAGPLAVCMDREVAGRDDLLAAAAAAVAIHAEAAP